MEKLDMDQEEEGNGANDTTGITDGLIITNIEHW